MPLRRGISDLVAAIEDRIEVAGHAPTWRVTGGSFEAALAFAREAYDDPVVVARSDHDRWWPRVTLTVTTDPALAAGAPAFRELARPRIPEQPRANPDRPGAAPATRNGFLLDDVFRRPPGPKTSHLVATVAPVLVVVLTAIAVVLAVVLLFVHT